MPQRLTIAVCLCGVLIASALEPPAIWLDVPFVQQQKDGCGAAVIAMVMQYWQAQPAHSQLSVPDPLEIQRALFSRPAHGIYAADLQRYFEEHGFQAFAFRGDWEVVRSNLEKGRPLVAALRPSKGESSLHYVVIAGLDLQNGLIMVNDPAQKKLLQLERKRFDEEWNAVGRWTLLAVPK